MRETLKRRFQRSATDGEGWPVPVPEGALGWLRAMRLASDLRESTWSYLQARISTVETPESYLARGASHLQQFLSGWDAMSVGAGGTG